MTHRVYIVRSADRAIYVGCSRNVAARLQTHWQWLRFVEGVNVELEGPFDEVTALRRERELVELLDPDFNIVGTRRLWNRSELSALRINAGYSVHALALELGVPQSAIHSLERGGVCTPENALKIATFFGRTVLDVAPGLLNDPIRKAA